jgi:histidinol-phosphate/aromatic aminotransferase/cobyric acid decarboxylase-like protein
MSAPAALAPVNGAGFTDAACVVYYRTLRDGVPPDARQIGYGVNKWPVSPVLRDYFARLYRSLLGSRMTEYDAGADASVRTLIAELASEYLQVPDLDESQVVLCHGTTEAISIACGFFAGRNMASVLPLPVYYAFEQSAIRAGLPVSAYYDPLGRHVGAVPPGRGAVLVDVAPNGVLGTWFRQPRLHGDVQGVQGAAYQHVLIDHVFSLPTLQDRGDFLAQLRERVRRADDSTVFLTPSKDLSLPGLRSGVMLTTSPGLAAYAQADRFERGYTVHGAIGTVAAAHLALVLLSFTAEHELPGMLRRIRAAFAKPDIPFPDDADVHDFLTEGKQVRDLFSRNLDVLRTCDFLTPVAGAEEPVAGYSTFRWMDREFDSPDAFTGWLNSVGRAGLKLNSNYLFGATPEVWEQLYPGRHGIRINISVPTDELSANIDLLKTRL